MRKQKLIEIITTLLYDFNVVTLKAIYTALKDISKGEAGKNGRSRTL